MNKYILGVVIAIVAFAAPSCTTEEPEPQNLPEYSILVNMDHVWNGQDLELNGPYYMTEDQDSFQLTKLIYHINNFKFYDASGALIQDKGAFFMVNVEDDMSPSFDFSKFDDDLSIDSISFTLGVADSSVNANGDLNTQFTDPMYWGMINGYINFKLEGLSPSVSNNAVVLHVGGYLAPYMNSHQYGFKLNAPAMSKLGSNEIDLELDLSKYFYSPNIIDLDSTHMIHSPNDASAMIVENWADMITLQ